MSTQVKYYWKELSTDGLLREPPQGTSYNINSINDQWNPGFASEDAAVKALERFLEQNKLYPDINLVLVPIYSF
jgi:hypothetical protein